MSMANETNAPRPDGRIAPGTPEPEAPHAAAGDTAPDARAAAGDTAPDARAAAKETRPLEQAEPAEGVPIYYRISNPERTVRAAVAPEKETRLKKGALRRSWSFCAFHGCGALLETACFAGSRSFQ